MIDLTIFVVATGKHEWSAIQEAADKMGAKCIPIGDMGFNFVTAETKWKMFLWDDEVLTPQMQEAIVRFVELGEEFDFFSCYKIEYGAKRVTSSPRLFKSHIKLPNNSLVPEGSFKGIHILDGFIRSEADVVH